MNKMNDKQSSFKFGSNCVICKDIEIKGDVTLGNDNMIHPRVRILAEGGPIIIGDNNLIEERTVIWNKPPSDGSISTPVMIIGNHNVFEVDSQCFARKVGDNNVVEAKGVVGQDVDISDGCVIGAGCTFLEAETLPRSTAVYGELCQRRKAQGHQSQSLQMDALAKILPMYNDVLARRQAPS